MPAAAPSPSACRRGIRSGDTFTLKECAGSANACVTLGGNGKLIEGSATLLLNVPYRCRVLRYSEPGDQWEVIGGIG